MTIASTITSKQYTSNGATTQYAFPNKIFSASDLVVTLIDLVGNQYPFVNSANAATGLSYSVQGVDVDTGCTVVFSGVQAFGWTVDLRTQTPEVQSTSVKNQGSFLPELHEEAFDRATRQIQDLLRLTYTYGIHGPDIETTPWPALPIASVRAGFSLVFDNNGLPALGTAASAGTITGAIIANLLNLVTSIAPTADRVRTPAEIAAGVTPTNFAYPPGYVDRYGTNTTPGTTSMVAAFQAAINVAKHTGTGNGVNVVTYGRTWPYLLDAPLDCTTGPGQTPTANGIIIRGEAQFLAFTNNAPYYPGLLAKHTGHVFDCTGTYGIVFENVTIGTDLVTYPQTGWFLARGTDKNSQHVHFTNCGFIGKASKAVLYNFGSEDSLQIGCTFINRATDAAAKTVWLTGTNILSLTSTFQAVASGGGTPCTVHLFVGGEYHNWGGSATGDVFAFDGCSKITLADFFLSTGAASAACRSYIYCETVNGPTNNVSIRGVVSEQNSFNPNYGVTFGTTAATPAAWLLDNNDFTVNTSKLFAPSAIVCDGFYLRAMISDVGSPNINFAGILQNSLIEDTETNILIGTSSQNRITASISALTVTTRSNDFWTCVGPLTWTPGTGALTHGGTLTVSNKAVQFQGGEVVHSCDLSDTVSLSCAQGTALTGLLRAPLADSALAIVTNAATGVVIGTARVSGTSLLLPAISVGAGITVIITARYFCI